RSRRAGSERESQRIAEAVREKDLRRRKHDVVFHNTEYAATIREPCVERVVLQMDDALRPPSRAGAVHPERHRVAMRIGGRELAWLLVDPFAPSMMKRESRRGVRRPVAHVDDATKTARRDIVVLQQRRGTRIDECGL